VTWPMSTFSDDDAARAESAWLLARENDPSAPPPSPEIAADYAELEDLLASLPSAPPDDHWKDQVLWAARALSPRQRWRTTIFSWILGGGLAAAAAAIVWMLLPHAPELAVAVRHLRKTRGRLGDVVVGDQLVVTVRPQTVGDLRVYRLDRSEGALVARCPNGPGCTGGSHGEQTLELTLDAPVQYQVIFVDGATDDPPDGTKDAYLEAARARKARIISYPPIDVH